MEPDSSPGIVARLNLEPDRCGLGRLPIERLAVAATGGAKVLHGLHTPSTLATAHRADAVGLRDVIARTVG